MLTRVLIGPPGWVLHSLVALAGLIILSNYSLPGGGDFIRLLLALSIALGTTIVWTARFGVGLLRSDGRPRLRERWLRWVTAPIMGVAVIGLTYFDVPSTARFALSESSLEDFARTVAAQPEDAEIGDTWVGLYPLTEIEPNEGGARFLVSGTGFLDHYGFAWSPKGPPPEESHTRYTHMDGPWYLWVSRF